MKLMEFTQKYPDEESCIAKLRELRERDVHVCPECGHKEWYWKGNKLCYECKKCHHRESIRKGTVMENETTFIRIYPLLSDIELADYYRVEVDSIQKRAKELGLKKDPSLTKYAFKKETDWGIAQRNTLDKLNNKRKELESKILTSEKFDEGTYEEWKVINLKCQGLESILKK
jgi:predicted RNA-binding Zn-ribbon protein involved in translation (DUF1610 family)